MNDVAAGVVEDPEVGDLDDVVSLPVGAEIGGTRFRRVTIDELTGVDEELASNKKKTGGNPAKALTLVLARAIQSIEGSIEEKRNPDSMIDRQIVRNMYQADRDYLIARIHLLAGKDEVPLQAQCPKCGAQHEEMVLLSERPVKVWPDDKEPQLEFDLPKGYVDRRDKERKVHKKGIIRFPRGIQQEAVSQLARNNQAQAMTAMLASCITKLGDLDAVDQDVVRRLRSSDRRYLFRLIRDEMPGMKMWEMVSCSECDNDELEATVSLAGFFD
jgi:hypothetical protein